MATMDMNEREGVRERDKERREIERQSEREREADKGICKIRVRETQKQL